MEALHKMHIDMRKIFALLLISVPMLAQDLSQPPVFPGCESSAQQEMEACFYTKVQEFVFANFKAPDPAQKSQTVVLFEVDAEGKFRIIYVDSPDESLAAESRRVFSMMPQVGPPRYNGNATYAKYTIRIDVPLVPPGQAAVTGSASIDDDVAKQQARQARDFRELAEYDSIKTLPFDDEDFGSQLNIPFSHQVYSRFDDELNQLGANNHTASKPFSFADVSAYKDLREEVQSLRKPASGWWGRKLWNEHFTTFRGKDFWFTLDPIVDLQLGKNTPGEVKSTYINTRGLNFRGGLGRMITFTTTVYESQGRFADYFNQYAVSIAPSGGGPAIIPGIGIAKEFKEDSFDFPMAEASVIFTPDRFFNLQLGYGKNFIGDGYRSLLQSDGASPYPFVKLNTTFWKIRYTNTYMWLKDVRPEVTEDRTYETKYMASHYLSWNVTKRLNLGFFESVVWANTNGRGFDANFVNPIIFYRAVEFSSSARSGNALLGLTGKYKWNNRLNFYGQFLLDEFSLNDVKAGNASWKNKFGYQIGAKYYHAFGVQDLMLQAEYNHVRPYVYAHSDPLTNYAHNNQSLGHQWGGNFREVIAIARYHRGRIFADAKLTTGVRGLDFDTAEDAFNYGGNIFKDYEENRPFNTGVKVGQGNKTSILIADFQAGYLVNPATNLKLFAGAIYRNFDPSQDTASAFKDSTTWFFVGLRTDLFNWYFDY